MLAAMAWTEEATTRRPRRLVGAGAVSGGSVRRHTALAATAAVPNTGKAGSRFS
jgi:hypothetical protein